MLDYLEQMRDNLERLRTLETLNTTAPEAQHIKAVLGCLAYETRKRINMIKRKELGHGNQEDA